MTPDFAMADFAIDRRALIQRVGLLLGATALPASAFAAPAKAKPFPTSPRFKLLEAVSDTIIPTTDTAGALAAGVPARLDGMLTNWASPATRTAIVEALDRIDVAARTAKGKSFAALSAAERDEVLRPHDAAALVKVPPPPGAPKSHPFAPANYVADQGYLKIKDLVLALYYFSEIATTTELIYEHVPGKFEPSIKLTADSRPYLGIGPF